MTEMPALVDADEPLVPTCAVCRTSTWDYVESHVVQHMALDGAWLEVGRHAIPAVEPAWRCETCHAPADEQETGAIWIGVDLGDHAHVLAPYAVWITDRPTPPFGDCLRCGRLEPVFQVVQMVTWRANALGVWVVGSDWLLDDATYWCAFGCMKLPKGIDK